MSLVKEHIRRLRAYEPGLQPAEGERVVKLNTNENPYPPSPRVLEAVRDAATETLRLYPDPQCRQLRQTAAALYGVEPSQVLCGNGSDEILGIILRTFTTRGDTIVIMSRRTPTMQPWVLFRLWNCDPRRWGTARRALSCPRTRVRLSSS